MAHIELNVTGAVACEGIGSYFASIYYADPSYRTKYKLAPLGRERPDTSKPAMLLEQLRKSMPAAARSLTVPIERFVAFSLLRACPLDRHADGAYTPGMGLRAERLASFVVAASLDDIEAIQPLRPDEAPSGPWLWQGPADYSSHAAHKSAHPSASNIGGGISLPPGKRRTGATGPRPVQ